MKKPNGISLFQISNPFWDKVFGCKLGCNTVKDCNLSCKNITTIILLFFSLSCFGQVQLKNDTLCYEGIKYKVTIKKVTKDAVLVYLNNRLVADGFLNDIYVYRTNLGLPLKW